MTSDTEFNDDDLSRVDEGLGLTQTPAPTTVSAAGVASQRSGHRPRSLRWPVMAVGALALVAGGFAVGRLTAPDTAASEASPVVSPGETPVNDEGADDTARLLEVALELHRTGDLNAATQAYQAVLAAQPDDQYALYNLGLISQTNNDVQGAIDYYDQAIESDPTLMSAIYNRGLAYRDMGQFDDAIVDLRVVVAEDPTAAALYNLGNVLIANGQIEEGTDLVAQAVELDPSLRGD